MSRHSGVGQPVRAGEEKRLSGFCNRSSRGLPVLIPPPARSVSLAACRRRAANGWQDGGSWCGTQVIGSCNIRYISGLSIQHFHRVQATLASSVTKPLLSVPDLPCRCPLSIFNRVTPLLPHILLQPVRTLTYYSLRKGKRKSVRSVVKRFLRLHCGLWLRRKAGYKKKLWKKSVAQKRRLREQVFCNKTQSKLLDKMTTSFWKRRNWYVDDPFQKYHDRTNLRL
ncbi:large ribosomal subunit protein bL35m isoform X1 [Pelodiscus sinensis]|uniref:large ribosomal subunit protein bL35m isoform X1 n=1 Tax=Pelodiscus sinensis TaxID=13735 RepID=UPI003F6B2061